MCQNYKIIVGSSSTPWDELSLPPFHSGLEGIVFNTSLNSQSFSLPPLLEGLNCNVGEGSSNPTGDTDSYTEDDSENELDDLVYVLRHVWPFIVVLLL